LRRRFGHRPNGSLAVFTCFNRSIRTLAALFIVRKSWLRNDYARSSDQRPSGEFPYSHHHFVLLQTLLEDERTVINGMVGADGLEPPTLSV
jgi:hypothetical protein